MLERSLHNHPDAPTLHNGSWRFNIASPLTQNPQGKHHPFVQRCQEQDDGPRTARWFCLQVATANVLTLFPGQDFASSFFSARAEALAAQWHEGGVHFVGLQETRSRFAGHARLGNFHVLSAAATAKGVGGTQLWVRRQFCDGDQQLAIEESHLYIVHASARRLVVKLNHPCMKLLIVVLHAPVTDDESDLETFWRATSNAIPSRFASWRWIVLADANSRLGSVTSEAVGDVDPEEENAKGSAFHQWLLQHSLLAPQTMPEFHRGTSSTWTHPAGTTGRIDYVVVSEDCRVEGLSTWVDHDIDLTVHKEDHVCVRATIPLLVYGSNKKRRRTSHHDSASPADISWSVDVHTHAAILQHRMQCAQKPAPVLRKQHLTHDTIQLIQAKRFHYKRLCQVRRALRLGLLRQMFEGWRLSRCDAVNVRPWIVQCDHAVAIHMSAYMDLAPRVVQAVRADDQIFYENLAQEAGRADCKGPRHLWAAIRHVLPKWKHKRTSNLRCTGPTIEDKFAHYNKLEAGLQVEYEHLLAHCNLAQRDRLHDAPLAIQLRDLPTRGHIELLMARQKEGKAPGLDLVLPSTLKKCGPAMSDEVTMLFMKMWLTGAEPFQFKGGLIHTIGKKVQSTRIADMRGIALLDSLGKLGHAVLRAQMMPALTAIKAPLQLGGFANQSTLFATHYLRAFTQLAADHKISSAILYIDIKSAFHSMLRELVFDMQHPFPKKLQEILHAQGSTLSDIQARIATENTLSGIMPSSTARLLADAHHCTWYTVASADEMQHTIRGSRPGSPLADAAYNALMARLIGELQPLLFEHAPLIAAFTHLQLRAPIVAWVDDIAIPVATLKAQDLTSCLTWTLQQVRKLCLTYGLTLNLKPTKTETVVAFRGDGAPACRQDLQVLCQGHIHRFDDGQTLRAVPQYEHLGAIFTAEGRIDAELKHRLARAIQAHHQIRRPILKNRHLSCSTRLRLLECLIAPILFHGAGNWPLLTQRQLQKLHAVYLKWIRTIVANGCWTENMLTDNHLLMVWGLPSISLRLAKARLLYAFQLVRHGPTDIIDMVTSVHKNPQSWFPALRRALQWLSSRRPDLFDWDPLVATPTCIFDWIRDHLESGPRLVRKAYHSDLQQFRLIGRAAQRHLELANCFRDGSVATPPAPAHLPSALPHECRLCAATFHSLHRLHVHQWLAHEVISPERAMMSTTICPACHKCFWSAQRLQQHLRYSRRHPQGCYAQLTWRCAPWNDVPNIDEENLQTTFLRQPATAVDHVPSRFEVEIASRDDADRCLQQQWQQENLPLILVRWNRWFRSLT